MAIRAGLPLVANRFQSPRPEGYFADAYKRPRKEPIEIEDAAGKMKLSPPLESVTRQLVEQLNLAARPASRR